MTVYQRRWTADEHEFAVSHLTRWSVEAIARHLGRTPASVRSHLDRTGDCVTRQDLVTSGIAAEISGYTQQWLTELARAGRIPARRIPCNTWWLFDPERLPRRAA